MRENKTQVTSQTLEPTPTASADLPPRLADFATLADALDYAAKGEAGFNFYDVRGNLEEVLTYSEMRKRARAQARKLLSLGLERGDKIGIVADMEPYFLTTFFACQYAGLWAVPLPVITGLGGRHGYEQQLEKVLTTSNSKVAIGPESLQEYLRDATAEIDINLLTPAQLDDLAEADIELEPLGADEESHIQFSSGSTRHPKGIVISQSAMMNNAHATINDGLECNQAGRVERITSWLPFYHDMGLIGCMLTPICCQFSVDLLHTDSFARSPLQWLRLIAKNKSTLSYGPTFGYEICTRRVSRLRDENLDLSAWRVAGIGGEMVNAQVLADFAEAYKPHGFDPRALTPSYGLAEATLAVSFSEPGKGVVADVIDKKALLKDEAVPTTSDLTTDTDSTRVFVSCGKLLDGYGVEIRSDEGTPLPERKIGRVCLNTPSLMTGYFADPEATAETALAGGWLDTGDMGYMVGGNLFLTGRKKDMIIINGRNIWPQDMEWHAEQSVDILRSRDTAAFAVADKDGKEKAVILAQARTTDPQKQAALKKEVHAAVYKNTGVDADVVLVPQRSLPYTTSGKLSRAKAKKGYLEGTIKPLGGTQQTSAA